MATVLETFSYLSQHPGISHLRGLGPFNNKLPVLRPGQYRDISGQQYVLGTPDDDIVEEVDEMGRAQ